MSEFKMFDSLVGEFEKTVIVDEDASHPKCEHINKVPENGMLFCMDCGEEIEKITGEWKYHDSKHSADPNRCQIRRVDDRNIYKDVEGMGFSDKVVSIANQIYLDTTKCIKIDKNGDKIEMFNIYRGKSRKSIVFGCVFNAYKLLGDPQTYESLIKVFKIDKKSALSGLKFINMNAPKKSPVRTTYITPVNLVEDIMNKFSASIEQKKEVVDLYHNIKNKSSKLNRSRPQSVASGLVYYWIQKTGKDITIKEFIDKVDLSELTILKIVKEIESVLTS